MATNREREQSFGLDRKPYGLTGEVGKDGVLTAEQKLFLDQLQSSAANNIMAYFDSMQPEYKRPLVAMATGIGKGKIIHEVIRRQKALKPDSKILVITGTKLTLVTQTQRALSGYQEVSASDTGNGYSDAYNSVENAFIESEDIETDEEDLDENTLEEGEFDGYVIGRWGKNKDMFADVQLATIQAIQSSKRRGVLNPNEFDLVVVDEVHNVGTKQRLEAISTFSRVVGFTATPYRSSGSLKTPEDYGFKVIISYPLPEAQEARLLPPLYALQISTAELIDEIPTTKSGKIDYTKLERMLKNNPELRPYIVDKILPIITLNGNNYKTVIAVNYVWEAQEIAELLKIKGVKVGVAVNQQAAKAIHSEEIPATDSIDRYSLPQDDPRSIQVLISPYVASEGFDAPQTEMLVWASPTDSHLRYTQYTGRLARRENGKAYGVVIDCVYQTAQYGWTYNFAMWMKGYVRHLPSGMLYLGPMQQIPNISALQQMYELSDGLEISYFQPIPSTVLRDQYNVPITTYFKLVHKLMIDFPEEIKGKGAGNLYYASSKGIEILVEKLLDRQNASVKPSEGFVKISANRLGKEYSITAKAVITRIQAIKAEHEDWVKGGGSGLPYYLNSEADILLKNMLEERRVRYENVLEGFKQLSSTDIMSEFQITDRQYWRVVARLRAKYPTHFIKQAAGKPSLADEEGMNMLKKEFLEISS